MVALLCNSTGLHGDRARLKVLRMKHLVIVLFVLAAGLGTLAADETVKKASPWTSLFDGRSLKGWEGDLRWFRVEDGVIKAGSLEQSIPHNQFLCTSDAFGDFELRLEVKITPPKTNAGIQFRSLRIPGHHEVLGYQADAGGPLWGDLYDESRDRKTLAGADREALAKVLKPDGWNEYVIRCQGSRVQLWLNGLKTVDYTEQRPYPQRQAGTITHGAKILPPQGIVGLQIHGGPPGEAWYKGIRIKKL